MGNDKAVDRLQVLGNERNQRLEAIPVLTLLFFADFGD